jgi:hypothetical protein
MIADALEDINLKVTYAGNSLTLIATFSLLTGLLAVPSLRQTVVSRIVLWISLW